MGTGGGPIVHLGKLPVNLQLAYYYNVERPDFGSRYQWRTQAVLMFPK